MFARSIRRDHKRHPLGGVSLFQGWTGAELDTVVSITTPIYPSAGRVLCREGERGDEFFVIVDGEAAVTIAAERVATLGSGDFFGEMALLDGGPRIATVTATTPARMLVLTRPEFNALLERVPTVCHRVLIGVGHRLRQPVDVGTAPVAARTTFTDEAHRRQTSVDRESVLPRSELVPDRVVTWLACA